MQPVYKRKVCRGGVEVSVYGAQRNWNFAGETKETIEAGNHGITKALAFVIDDCEVMDALVPKPAFNAKVVESKDLSDERLPSFFRGADADGVLLDTRRQAYFLASADCLTTVLYDVTPHRAIAMHCGRDALIDRGALSGKPARQFASVIDAGMQRIIEGGWSKSMLLGVYLAAGIGPATFTHPTTPTMFDGAGNSVPNTYREANATLISFLTRMYNDRGFNVVTDQDQGKINLVELVIAQLSNYGVTREQIVSDGVDTATDTGPDGQFLFHSNRRDKTKRNLVVVKLL